MGRDKITQLIGEVPRRSRRCENCEHFSPEVERVKASQCRAALPQAIPTTGPGGQVAVISYWPTTQALEWCGKWETRVTPLDESATS